MAQSIQKLKFEDAMRRLDAIVEAMERGDIGIEDSIRKYEEAMALKAHCQRILDSAEQRIRTIQLAANGGMVEGSLDPQAPVEESENP